MTLNITIVAPWGVWQCSDHRLTDPKTGRLLDDYSIKHVTVRCADGAALITYTGIGRVGESHISNWLRGLIRGKTRSLDETFISIREGASKWISPVADAGGCYHIFSIGAFLAGHPWAVIISNIPPTPDWQKAPPTPAFHTSAKKVVAEPLLLVTGIGKDAVAPSDMELLVSAVKKRPNKPQDFHALLAGVNQRASAHPTRGRFVSAACVTAYMPPSGEPIEHRMHGWEAEEDRAVPILLFGINCTDSTQVLMERLRESVNEGKVENEAEFHRRYEEAAKRGVQTEEKL